MYFCGGRKEEVKWVLISILEILDFKELATVSMLISQD
jgi:hypothetical protein